MSGCILMPATGLSMSDFKQAFREVYVASRWKTRMHLGLFLLDRLPKLTLLASQD
jgi:hypothetical protein